MPVYEVNLKQLFTPKVVAEALTKLPKFETPVMDTLFTDRRTWPFPSIGISEIEKTIGNQPVVRREAPSIQVDTEDKLSIQTIEPQPIKLSVSVGAKELNDLKLLDATSLDAWRNEKIQDLRNMVKLTCEALCSQALRGKIQYPMKYEGGYTYYEVDFGAPLSYTPAKTWDSAEIQDILLDLINMQTSLKRKRGYGSKILIWAGATVFSVLAGKIIALSGNGGRISAKVDEQGINIAGFSIKLFNAPGYKDHKTGEVKTVVGDKELVMIALDAPFRFYYLAIDDLDAKFQATPFFVKPIKQDDPSGYKIIAQSKPLPVPVPAGILWATVIS